MPGLSQLKKLSEDVVKLGNEPRLRAERGEKPSFATIPSSIPDIDDSEDFVLGMPSNPNDNQPENSSQNNAQNFDDNQSNPFAATDSLSPAQELESMVAHQDNLSNDQNQNSVEPDFSSLLNPLSDSLDDAMPDLSAFDEDAAPKNDEPSIADMSLDDLLNAPPTSDFEQENFDLPQEDDLSQNESFVNDNAPDFAEPVFDNLENLENSGNSENLDNIENLDDFGNLDNFNIDDISNEQNLGAENNFGDEAISENKINIDNEINIENEINLGEESNLENEINFENEQKVSEPLENENPFADFATDQVIDLNADLPEEISEGLTNETQINLQPESSDEQEDFSKSDDFSQLDLQPQTDDLSQTDSSKTDSIDNLDFGDLSDFNFNDLSEDSNKNESLLDENFDNTDAQNAQNNEIDSSSFDDNLSDEINQIPTSSGESFDAFDTSGLDDFGSLSEDNFSQNQSPASNFLENSVEDFGEPENLSENIPVEDFDLSEMDGVNFSDLNNKNESEKKSSDIADFEIPDTDSQIADFELASDDDQDFEIEGYTGEEANPFDEKGRIKSQIPQKQESKQKNSLTDEEYKKFKKNLSYYPLNVRLAIEDLIVKNELTDDAIFEVIEKVVKKIPVRQFATHLEKLLDIQLPVPRDFERRTAEEYESYKASLQYQLKNKIIPAIAVGLFIFMIGFCSVYLGAEYVVKPIHAEILYKQGYSLLENDEYPQSEIMFNRALELKQKKKWFFKYANGYRQHKQFDRAEVMYKNILSRFNHDKIAGLEYARMQFEDLINYQKAEKIIKREVLDYHINDTDAILLLGDIYLEWGTESDPAKFEDALEQYSILRQLPKTPPQVDARLMVYNVRTDNLKGVLTYKELFFPNEKSLNGDEWTEMSGYLMDKLYGDLAPSEEYLRASIEDVFGMLVRAIKKSPENPISRYNIARYYIESGNRSESINELKKTIDLFSKATRIKKRDLYKQINTYRLLGEQHLNNRDYLLAQETFASGIDLFEEKQRISGFESDKQIGIMYADMANIDYFISGDLENAERNYLNSVNNKNDTPSIRYKLGYINYGNQKYDEAINDFLIASNEKYNDENLNLALANSFALKNDNYVSIGYYERLLNSVELKLANKDIVLPQIYEEDGELVDLYMKVSNNLGVGQYRIAKETGDSLLNGKSLNNFQNSLKAWDSLTRNPVTMIRLNGTNLAEQNLKYSASAYSQFEPAIYTDIARTLQNEKILE